MKKRKNPWYKEIWILTIISIIIAVLAFLVNALNLYPMWTLIGALFLVIIAFTSILVSRKKLFSYLNLIPIWSKIIFTSCLVIILLILIFVPRKTPPPTSEFPEFIIHGVLPVHTIKKRPDMQLHEDFPVSEEQGLYFVIELSSKDQTVNVSSLEMEGRLYLNMREYAFYLEENFGKKPPELNKEIAKKKPYFKIKWIAWPSRPDPPRLDAYDNKLFLFTFLDPAIESPNRFFLTKNDARGYIGYENPEHRPKLESTHPNLVEFTETEIINNEPIIVGLRDDFRNGNIKYYLKIGEKKIPIEKEKIRNIETRYPRQEENLMQIPLEKIYYRKIY